jgi:NADH-quinone oxidoreductase subunit H
MQCRIGPNRTGFIPEGFLQWAADAVKLIHKEDIIPAAADGPLFRASPYLVFLGMFATFAVIPFAPDLLATDLNIGIFYLLAVTSLVVVGVLMAGWSSNNKWSLLGGFRSAAQIVSYEIPAALSIGAVVLSAGSLGMTDIVKAQEGWGIFKWHIFQHPPFLFIAAVVFFTSALAEINRVPFDIPEAESELVSGYNTEYSGMRFSVFFLAEWANVFVVSAVTATVFLGGWSPTLQIENEIWRNAAGLIVFMIKSCVLCFVVLWLRWTLPRLRVDQLMSLCWKYLTPIAFVNLFGVALWMLLASGRAAGR